MQSRLFLARIVLMGIGMQLLHAIENQCNANLPPFAYQNPGTPVLPVGVQVLLPAQTFTCSGSITMWGIAVNGSGSHDVHLQIWRPSSAEADNETRSFMLVGSNIFYVEPIPGISLFYLMPDEQRALSVERGDVLGLYIEARGTEESFRLQYQENVTDSVIYTYAADSALDFIEPDLMQASSVILQATPVMSVVIEPEVVATESTTPTIEGTTPTDSSISTTMSESTTATTEGIITAENPTSTPTQTTTIQLQEDTTSPLSTPITTPTTPTYPETTPTHPPTHWMSTDTIATPTVRESIFTTSEGESTEAKKPTSQPAESDKEETVATTKERSSNSPDETKPTLALPVVMMTSAMAVGIVGVCLVVTVMLVRGVRRRSHRGHGHCLPHKSAASLPPPPMSPPPPPPQYEVGGHTKERNFQAKLASSLSSSLTSSLIWWLHGEKEQLRMLMAREYETPIVTKCHMAVLESSMHDYDTPVAASAKVVNLLHSSHHYEDIS